MNYALNIMFDDKDLLDIYDAKQSVTLIKQTFSTTSNNSSVAWVTFNPFEINNVNWEENYTVYASTTQVQNGASILKSSYTDAVDGFVYNFGSGVFLKNPNLSTEADSYEIINTTTGKLTFGLAQDVKVNGSSVQAAPINAATVLAGQNAIFTPLEKVQILLQSNVQDGLVLTSVSSQIFTATLGNGVNSVSVKYNGLTGQFVQV